MIWIAAQLAGVEIPDLLRLAEQLRCRPRDRQPGESAGAYTWRLRYAIVREVKRRSKRARNST